MVRGLKAGQVTRERETRVGRGKKSWSVVQGSRSERRSEAYWVGPRPGGWSVDDAGRSTTRENQSRNESGANRVKTRQRTAGKSCTRK